jgi:hypothetical protein
VAKSPMISTQWSGGGKVSEPDVVLESPIHLAYSYHLFLALVSLSFVFWVTPSSLCMLAANKSPRSKTLDGLGKDKGNQNLMKVSRMDKICEMFIR